MSLNLLSTGIVTDIRQKLLAKINKLIAKRALLFANMNRYSFDQLSKLMEETNQQLFIAVKQANILEVPEIGSIPTDNLMAMCDSKSLMQETTQVTEEDKSVASKFNDSHRRRRFSVISRTERTEHEKPLSLIQNRSGFVPLRNGDSENESREIQAYREMKKKEFEERAKKLAQQIKNKERTPINLNIEDVMYDYECRVTTLDKAKERKFKSVPQISPSVKNEYDEKKKRKLMRELMEKNIPNQINEKTNITIREIQAEKQKKKKSYSKVVPIADTESMFNLVKVNLQSHKQIEDAINVREPGIKITIKERQFNMDKESTRSALTKITKRLSRSQYIQFKADEQKKKLIKNSHLRFIEKTKIKVEEVKTEALKEETKPTMDDTTKTSYKLSLSLDNHSPNKDQSRMFIHSLLGKAELIKQVKQKPYLTEPHQQSPSKKDSLSTVDKYNLLYVKYNGNPPQAMYQNLTKELQTQRKEVQKIKQNAITFHQNRKQNNFRQSRLVSSRKS